MLLVFVLFAFARGEAADQTGHQQKKSYIGQMLLAAQWPES